jgi:hypothetical protein
LALVHALVATATLRILLIIILPLLQVILVVLHIVLNCVVTTHIVVVVGASPDLTTISLHILAIGHLKFACVLVAAPIFYTSVINLLIKFKITHHLPVINKIVLLAFLGCSQLVDIPVIPITLLLIDAIITIKAGIRWASRAQMLVTLLAATAVIIIMFLVGSMHGTSASATVLLLLLYVVAVLGAFAAATTSIGLPGHIVMVTSSLSH